MSRWFTITPLGFLILLSRGFLTVLFTFSSITTPIEEQKAGRGLILVLKAIPSGS